jgi:serine protease AprX
MAPDAYLAIFKIFPDNATTLEPATIYHIVISIVQAVKVGVDVMNASWGFIGFSAFTQGLLYLAVSWAIQNGLIWVNSAGNSGPQLVSSGWPAQHESVITVGATYPENFITAGYGQKVVFWSSRGPTYPANSFFQHGADILPTKGPLSAGRVKPDVLAPGFGIMAANAGFEYPSIYEQWDATNPPEDPPPTIHVGTMYKTLSGTSMSAPIVTGIVALLLQAFPASTPAAIKAALIKGATKTTTLNGQDDPNIVGAGLVNALEAYNILKNAPKRRL